MTRRFVAPTMKGLEYRRDNRSEGRCFHDGECAWPQTRQGDGAAILVHNFLTFESDVAARLPVGSFDAEQLKETWEVVAEAQDFDAAAVDPESFVTRDFLP